LYVHFIIHHKQNQMKNIIASLFLAVAMGIVAFHAQSQDKIVLPANYQVDTRIDNMGYWRKMAEFGLVPVEPMHKTPPAEYSGSRVFVDGVLVDDSPDVPVTTETSTQSENSTVVNPNNNLHIVNSNNSTPVPAGSIYGANYFHSFDGALTFDGQIQGAGGSNSGDPVALINLSGRYFIGYIDNASGQSVSYSDDQGATWTVKKVSNGTLFNMLDKNHLWVDNSPVSPFMGYLYDGWMESNNIYISRSITNGSSWEAKMNISTGTSAGSHNQGVNFKTGPDGQTYAAWSVYDSWPSDEKAIGFSKSLDGGATWTTATRIINNIRGIRTTGVTPNQRTNSFPCMTVDLSNGPDRGSIYIVWSNIGVPGVNTGTGCDVYIIKSTDDGATWSAPLKINTDAAGAGKDHYFPWITCDKSNGMLSVVFMDNRNVANNKTEAWMAYSDDGGATWTDMKVSDVSTTPSPIPGLAGGYMGDYLGIDAYGGKTYPTWCDNRSGQVMTYVSVIDLIIPAPNLVADGQEINDTTFGNGDGVMSYGDTILLGVKIKNIGTLDADNVVVNLKSSSPYITFLDTTENYGAIAKGASKMILAGYKFAVSNNVPDNTAIEFTCEAHDQNDTVTVSTFNITARAPQPTIISMAVNDATGNNNGRLDPGETVTLNILTKNTGLYTAENVISTLTSNNPFVTVLNGTYPIGNMLPGQENTAVYTVTVDPTAYIGSAVIMHNVAQALYQSDTKDFVMPIGLIVEDWETGDFTKFNWEFGGDANWTIDPSTKWEGNFGSKSGVIGDNQKSELIINYNVMFDDSISFYRKVSSQVLGDFLKFYIDGLMVGTWSGNQDWKRMAYPVLAGPHTFKWVYEKNASGTGNQDCAWTDFIVFPPEYKLAVNAGANAASCGTSPYQLEAMAVNYDSLLWATTGTGVFSDPKVLTPTYTPSISDVTSGSVTLSLTAYAMAGIDSTSQMTLTFSQPATAAAGADASVCSNGSYTLGAATATNYTTLEWTTKGDGTFDNSTLLNPVYTPGLNDIATGTAELKLTAIPSSVCPPVSDSLLLTVLPSPVVNLGPDTAICAHLSFTLDATTPDAVSYLWTPGNATTPTIVVDSVGSGIGVKQVTVVVTVANGCQGTDAVSIQFKDCTGISELEGVNCTLYPNPAANSVTVELTSGDPRTITISVLSVSGEKLVNIRNLALKGMLKQVVDLSKLTPGTYLVEVGDGTGKLVKKLVVTK
jgi:hypothetical protein